MAEPTIDKQEAASCDAPDRMADPRANGGGGGGARTADAAHFVRHGDEERSQHGFPLVKAFSCAWEGITYAFTSQRNLKIHLAFAVIAVVLGFALRISEAGWLAVVLSIALVMALEIVNTAVESVVDLVSPEWHILAKRAKDCAAGAVYLAAFASIVVACIVFLPRIAALLL